MQIRDYVWGAIGLLWAADLSIEVVRRKRGGVVLLDFGAHKNSDLYAGTGAVLVLSGFVLTLTNLALGSPHSQF